MKLLNPYDPWLPWPEKCEWAEGRWIGNWRGYRVGPGLRNRFWATYSVILYRLVGSKIDYEKRNYLSRWYEWLYWKGWVW